MDVDLRFVGIDDTEQPVFVNDAWNFRRVEDPTAVGLAPTIAAIRTRRTQLIKCLRRRVSIHVYR